MSEKQFAKNFEDICICTKGFQFLKIPDIVVTREMLDSASTRGRLTARKLPCDGILVTPAGVVCIELKYAYGSAKPHQVNNCITSNYIYPCSYLFVREKKNKYYLEYHDLKSKEVLSECDRIEDLPMTILKLQHKARLVRDGVNMAFVADGALKRLEGCKNAQGHYNNDALCVLPDFVWVAEQVRDMLR